MLSNLSNWLFKMKCKYWNKYYAVFPRQLDPKNYHPHNRRLIFAMMDIVQGYLDLKYGNDPAKIGEVEEMDTELIEIAFWWQEIFLPKSQACYTKYMNAESEVEMFRTANKIEVMMKDLEDYLHVIIENIAQMGI